MKTSVFIDGYNLFYGALKGTQYKWLDLKLLCQNLLPPECEIVSIDYYTAMVKNAPGKLQRQEAYLRALKAHIPEFRYTLGRHQITEKLMPTAVPSGQDSKGKITYSRGSPVLVIKSEEKKSDVNLAVDIVNLAWKGTYDCAVLISNDSDLATPLLLAKNMGKQIGLATTVGKPAAGLKKIPHFHRHITTSLLKNSQLPLTIEKPNSEPVIYYRKPNEW